MDAEHDLSPMLILPDHTAIAVGGILKSINAVIVDHVVLASMLHAGVYFNVKKLFSGDHPRELRQIASRIALQSRALQIDAVIGPETGGSRLASETAKILGRFDRNPLLRTFGATKTGAASGPKFRFSDDDRLWLNGRRILLVEDVITTAGSLLDVANLLRECGGIIVKIMVVVDRTGRSELDLYRMFNFAVHSLVRARVETWEVSECPLCKTNVPVRPDLGRGQIFLDAQMAAAM